MAQGRRHELHQDGYGASERLVDRVCKDSCVTVSFWVSFAILVQSLNSLKRKIYQLSGNTLFLIVHRRKSQEPPHRPLI
eukprot:4160582-Pleurochrysis_carterae.AAC.1